MKLPALDALRRAFETASVLAFGLYLLGRESCGLRRIVDRMGRQPDTPVER